VLLDGFELLEDLILLIAELADDLELLTVELVELTDDLTLLEVPTIPYGAGCPEQVTAEMQFLLFSQPHPLWVTTHSGYNVPYQLHC
jgi:hypothetical protein